MINAIYPSNQIDVIPQGSGNVLLRIKAGVIPPPASPNGYTKAEVDALLASTLARALRAIPAATTVPSTLPPSGPAGGDLSGTYPNPSVVDDSHSHTPGVSIPAYPTGLPPSGAAGGDLSGTYPNPSVVDDSHAHTPGVSIPAYPTTLPPDGPAGGDLTGTYPNPTLGAVGAATGPLGSSTTVAVVTIDAKGRVTALTSTAISGAGLDTTAVHSTGGLSSYTTGDLLYASNASTLSLLAGVAAGSWLRSGGVGTAPAWSTTTLPNSAVTGDLLYASTANTYANLAGVATGNALISGGIGAAPSWGKVTSAHTTGLASSGANSDITSMSGLTGALASPTQITFSGGQFLAGSTANVTEIYNSTTAQTLAVFNTRTSATNFERGYISWSELSNTFTIGVDVGSGGGTARHVAVRNAGVAFKGNFELIDTSATAAGTGGNGCGFTLFGSDRGSGSTGRYGFFAKTGGGSANLAMGTQVNAALDFYTNATLRWQIVAGGDLTAADARNIVFGTGTGTKIGTATSQKLSLWNATPIVQPTTAIAASIFVANTSGIVDDTATWDGYKIGQVVKALRNVGLLA